MHQFAESMQNCGRCKFRHVVDPKGLLKVYESSWTLLWRSFQAQDCTQQITFTPLLHDANLKGKWYVHTKMRRTHLKNIDLQKRIVMQNDRLCYDYAEMHEINYWKSSVNDRMSIYCGKCPILAQLYKTRFLVLLIDKSCEILSRMRFLSTNRVKQEKI